MHFDCIEEYSFPAPGKCITRYRSRVWSYAYNRYFSIQGDKALHDTVRQAIAYARYWASGAA